MPLVSIFGAALTNLIERSFKVSIHTNLGQMEMFIPHITTDPHSRTQNNKRDLKIQYIKSLDTQTVLRANFQDRYLFTYLV